MSMTEKDEPMAPRGDSLDGMRPAVRKAFEDSYKRHEEALRRLAKL